MTELQSLGQTWNSLGQNNPMWAILTKSNGKEWDPAEFFRSGEEEIAAELSWVQSLGIDIAMGRALDFGCGLGRLTQPLADHFQGAVGVDIAASMIEGARASNRRGARCEFVHNDHDDLCDLRRRSLRLHLQSSGPPTHAANSRRALHDRVRPGPQAGRNRLLPDDRVFAEPREAVHHETCTTRGALLASAARYPRAVPDPRPRSR